MALAQFGTAGSYYKPEHDDPAPELAMVDAARGRLRDRLPLSRIGVLHARNKGLSARSALGWANGIVLADGRIAALIATNGPPERRALVHWVEGTQAVELTHPAPREQWTRGALLPSGRAFLLTRELKLAGNEIICEVWSGNCPRTPPPTARTGPLLELREARTARVIWTLTATADRFWSGDVLQVAPDGRFALVSYPPAANTAQIAVVRIADGALVQTLPLPAGQAGFADGGRTIWVGGRNAISLYRRR